jgi:hypothetical protein
MRRSPSTQRLEEQMPKLISVLCIAALLSTAAIAQTTAPPPPKGPTDAQCKAGFKEGMGWTRDQFTAACQKMQQKKNNP